METEPIGSSIDSFSAVATAPSISSPSCGGEAGFFSFANTTPFSFSSEISDGGSFEPNFSLRNSLNFSLPFSVGSDFAAIPESNIEIPEVFKTGLAKFNLDPDIPDSTVPEVFENAFKEEDLLTPPSYLETINEIDLVGLKSQEEIIEQINYSPEPVEAKMEDQPSVVSFQPSDFVMPGEIKISERVVLEAEDQVVSKAEDFVNPEPQIRIQTQDQNIINAVSEIEKIEVVEIEDIAEIALPEMQQSTQTYNALINAGIKTEEAGILVQQALVRVGTEPEVAVMVVEKLKTQSFDFAQGKNLNVRTATEISKLEKKDEEEEGEEESADAEAMADKEEKKLKFVVDKKALAQRNSAFKTAIEQASTKIINGMEVVNSAEVIALMPTGKEKPSINSEILPLIIDLLDLGLNDDGTYLEATGVIGGMGLRSRNGLYQDGSGIFRRLPPVALAQDGEAVGEKDRDRVFTCKPDPIRQLKRNSELPVTY